MVNLFITFEGLDGAGKDTQLQNLVDIVRNEKFLELGNKYSNVWITREPTNITPSGKEISQLIREKNVSKEDATRLYVQDRVEHTQIIKKVKEHSIIFCSRYDLSTLSYQLTQGMDFDYLYNLHKFNQEDGAIVPDITIVFDVTVKEALNRINSRAGVSECFEKEEFLTALYEKQHFAIEELRKKDNRTIIVVNANQSIQEVTKEMCQKLKEVLDNN